jgi:hypothetical protein
VGGGGAGTFEPGIFVMNDVAGCADNDRNGAMPLAVVDAEGSAAAADAVDAGDADGSGPVAPAIADMDVTGTAGVPGAIWPIGVAQVTNVPGVAGLDANGTGASVVPGVPGWVTAENGPGPLSGEIKIVPGVVGMPMAVVPRVETCAKPALQPNSRIPAVTSKRRASDCIPGITLACLCLMTHRDLVAFRQIDHRIEDDLITRLYAVMHLDFGAKVARDRDLLQMHGAVADHGDMQAVLIEYDRIGRYDHRRRLARNEQLDRAVDSGAERAVRIWNIDLGQKRPASRL